MTPTRVVRPAPRSPAIDDSTVPSPDARRGTRAAATYDFRRPSTLGRDVLRVLELGHETFSRRLGSGWGAELRSLVQVEPLGMDQSTYDDHVRSMPSPNVAILVALRPLPGTIVVDCNVQLALQMVERLLGAVPAGGVAPPRRPSEVEADLITHLAQQVVAALRETIAPLIDVELHPELVGLEFNPQLVQVAAPSDPALLLSYRIGVSGGMVASGFLTVAYPGPVLTPLLEMLAARRAADDRGHVDEGARATVAATLTDVPVTVAVRLNASPVSATDLAALRVGDVLRLDHRASAPVRGVVGDEDVLLAHLGRRGPRLAVQVREWLGGPPDPTPGGATDPDAHVATPATDRPGDVRHDLVAHVPTLDPVTEVAR